MNLDLIQYANYGVYAMVYLALVFMANVLLNQYARSTGTAPNFEIANGNTALGIRRAGFQFGLAISMLGVFLGQPHPNFVMDLMNTAAYGMLSIGFMWSSLFITDKVILPGIDNNEAIREGNTGVAIAELAALVGTGIIGFASIYGEGTVLSAVIYFIVGQATIVAMVRLYELFPQSKEMLSRIKDGEETSGLYLFFKIVPYALILMSAITGNASGAVNLQQAAIEYVFAASMGMVALLVLEWVIDLLIVTQTNVKESLEKNNPAPIYQMGAAKLGVALFLSFAIL